jgi:2-methylcitrate dehydratase PrpD
MTTTNVARAAAFAAGVRSRTLGDEVVDAAKKCLVDWMGVAVGARDEPAARAVRATVASWRAPGPAAVLFGERTMPAAAALANGTLAHCLDFDDTHVGSVAHLSAPSWAAVLAAGSAGGLRERDLVACFVAAYEVGARIGGRGFGIAVDHAGWHSTGVFGALAAAAGACAAMGLDANATGRALNAAATQVGGLTASFGTMAKPFHAGKAAFNGVLSAELAANGFVPAASLLEPGGGLEQALVHGETAHRLQHAVFDEDYEVLRNTFKPYACCLLTHATIDAGRALAAAARGRAVTRIVATVNPLAVQLAGKPTPSTPLEGKFSTAYCAALALGGHGATQGDFTPSRMADPALRALTGKVTLEPDAAMAETAARMRIEFADGPSVEHHVPLARGNPGNPLSWDDLRGKFMPLAEPVLGAGRAAALFETLRTFERPGSLGRALAALGETAQ